MDPRHAVSPSGRRTACLNLSSEYKYTEAQRLEIDSSVAQNVTKNGFRAYADLKGSAESSAGTDGPFIRSKLHSALIENRTSPL